MKEFIESQIEDLKKSISQNLPDYNDVKPGIALKILLAYDMVFRSNFILWLMLLQGKEMTVKGRQVVAENLKCEIEENHPQLLLNVLVPSLRFFDEALKQIYEEVDTRMFPVIANEVRSLTSSAASTDGFFIMAMLENASQVFIPWLHEIANHRLPPSNTQYFYLHGEADVEHAKAFLAAANDEYIKARFELCGTDEGRRGIMWQKQQQRMREMTEKMITIFNAIFSFAKVPQSA